MATAAAIMRSGSVAVDPLFIAGLIVFRAVVYGQPM